MRLHGQHQVVAHALVRKNARDLEAARQAQRDPPVHGQVSQVLAAQHDAPGDWREKARYLVHQRGLARPVGANERVDFARLYREAHMVRGQQAAKPLDQPLHLKKAHGLLLAHRSLSAASPLGA